LQKIRVLVADDNVTVLEELPELLEADGDITVVATAGNGWEAVSGARQFTPDVIVMDVKMPLLDGISATKMIKAARPEIGVIMLSIFDNKQYLKDSVSAGAEGYVVKSAATDELIEMIRRVAGNNDGAMAAGHEGTAASRR
jgi:DNA-binding NarL/FixJ family response regulator